MWPPFAWKHVWKGQSPRQHNGTRSTSPKMMQSLYHVKKIREKIISHSSQFRRVAEITIYHARDDLLRPQLSTTWWKRFAIITSAFTVRTCNLIHLTLSSLETSNYFSSLKPFGRSFAPAHDNKIAWVLVSGGLTQLLSCVVYPISVNSFGPSDALWRQRAWSSLYPPHNEVVGWGGGVYWFHSVRPSVRPSRVRPASRVRSVASTVLVGSISYLCIL